MRLLVAAVLIAACGSSPPASVPLSNAASREYQAPTLPAEWGALAGDTTVDADLDEDGTPEHLELSAGDDVNALGVSIDGAPVRCGENQLLGFHGARIVDINPALAGVELVVYAEVGDGDNLVCYVTKVDGKRVSLETTASRVEDHLVLVEGTCDAEATVYERTVSGFAKRPELAAGKVHAVRCCESDRCK